MGSITALFVRKVLRVLDTECSTDAMLRSVGLEPGSEVNASRMIPAEEYYTLLERAAGIDAHPTTIPLRAGAAMRCEDYGAFGLAWKSASDLRGSYERAERYARVLTNVSTYEMEAVDGGALMHLHREGRRRLGLRLSNEATIASIAAISREVSTETFTPMAVYFKHQAPESIAEHEAYFGCPVHFSSDRDALLVSDAALRTPNRVGDAGISRFFESHLEEEVARIEEHDTLDRQVRMNVSQSLSGGVPTLSEIAKGLGMSSRTLQRRLSDLGYTYQALVDDSRRQLAQHLLQESDFSLVDVAFMTGFSEQSAFTRAFKRWEGQTPRSFRLASQSDSH